MTDERHAHPTDGQPEIHIADHDVHGTHDGFRVWLNTGVSDFDGLCVGFGATRQAAVTEAAVILEWALRVLMETPPPAA